MGRATRIGKTAALVVVRAVWLSTLVILPLFGMWLASSLAAYRNATQWTSLLIGLLLFPIVPVAWDLIFVWRMRRRPERKRILTGIDRLVLRALLVNLVFAGGLVWQQPVAVYKALSVRGDWMLDGHDGPVASWMRARLFTAADWFRRGWTPGGHHYGESDQAPSEPTPPAPEPAPPPPPPVDSATPPPEPPHDPQAWPMPATIDPAVTAMPADVQTSIAGIGAYLAANVPDPRRRVKAVHDVVVARLSYDDGAADAITARRWKDVPAMDAEAVFARRTGVCEGYARLMVALGTASGLEVAYVAGFARQSSDPRSDQDDDTTASLEGNEHAWNAVRLDGQWYPLDATWDDGDDDYSTTYLLTPPSLFLLDHFPDDAAWQLVADRKSVAEFLRQPAVSVHFGELGLVLREPERSQVSVSGAIEVVLDNPWRRTVEATRSPASSAIGDQAQRVTCGDTSDAGEVRLRCDGLADGEWRVDLWAAPRGADRQLDHVGSIWVNSR